MPREIPVISLGLPEEEAAQAVKQACTDLGFFQEEQVKAAMQESQLFFALPLEEKLKYRINAAFRGFAPMGAEALDLKRKTKGDSKEAMYYGVEYAPGTPGAKQPLMGNNQWPDKAVLPGHKKIMEEYLAAMIRLGNRLLRLIALALDMPATAFDTYYSSSRAGFRIMHYDAVVSDPERGQFGAGAHTDYGMLTILKTDMTGGLQIELDDDWIDVKPEKDPFMVNLGDVLERWTNGKFRSTVHRVLTSGKERYSIGFFFDPFFDTKVEVLPQCCSAENPAKFVPTTFGEQLRYKLSTTYGQAVLPSKG